MPEQELEKPKQFNKLEILNEEDRLWKGWGSVEIVDKDGDLLPMSEFKKFMPVLMKRGGFLTDQHTNRVTGKLLNYEFKTNEETGEEGILLTGYNFKDYESDDMIWDKVKTGEYKGLSFGGRNKLTDVKFGAGVDPVKVLKGIEGFEFAQVEGPANDPSLFTEINYLAKSGKRKIIKKRVFRKGTDLFIRALRDRGFEVDEGMVRDFEEAFIEAYPEVKEVINDDDGDQALDKVLQTTIDKINKLYERKPKQTKKVYNIESGTITNGNAETFIKNNELKKLNKMPAKNKQEDEGAVSIESLAQEVSTIKESLARLAEVVEGMANGNVEATKEGDEDEEDEDRDKKKEDDDEEDKPEDDNADKKKEEGNDGGDGNGNGDADSGSDDAEEVDKQEGEKVTLPQDPTEKIQDNVSEGAETDDAGSNFVEKRVQKLVSKEIADIKKQLGITKSTTPRAGTDASDKLINKGSGIKAPKNFREANQMIRKMKRQKNRGGI